MSEHLICLFALEQPNMLARWRNTFWEMKRREKSWWKSCSFWSLIWVRGGSVRTFTVT